MKTYLGFDSLTLEEIEGYLDNEWNDFLPSYREECVKWLVKEVKRLRNITSQSTNQEEPCSCSAVKHIGVGKFCPDCGGRNSRR